MENRLVWAASIWLFCATEVACTVMCDLTLIPHELMLVNINAGDETYDFHALQVQCHDVWTENGIATSSRWPIYVKYCTRGVYDSASHGCIACPTTSDRALLVAANPSVLGSNDTFYGCYEQSEGSCLCSKLVNGQTGATFTTSPLQVCVDGEANCLAIGRHGDMKQPQQRKRYMMPELKCLGLEFASLPPGVTRPIIAPPVAVDAIWTGYRMLFNYGIETENTIYNSVEWVNHKLVADFLYAYDSRGVTTRVGPTSEELKSHCHIKLNMWLDSAGTQEVGGDQEISIREEMFYTPPCDANGIQQIKDIEVPKVASVMANLTANSKMCTVSRRLGSVEDAAKQHEALLRRDGLLPAGHRDTVLGRAYRDRDFRETYSEEEDMKEASRSDTEAHARRLETPWDQYDNMACSQKEYIVEKTIVSAISRAMALTTSDAWIGCQTLLSSFGQVTKIQQNTTTSTRGCIEAEFTSIGTINPAWVNDPCCNAEKAFSQCCAFRDIQREVNIVTFPSDAAKQIAIYANQLNVSSTLPISAIQTYAKKELSAAQNCFTNFKKTLALYDSQQRVDSCISEVEGVWSTTLGIRVGNACESASQCWTGQCEVPTQASDSDFDVRSGGQRYCVTPENTASKDFVLPVITCLLDQMHPRVKEGLACDAGNCGTSANTTKLIQQLRVAQPDLITPQCRGTGWDAYNQDQTACLAQTACNWDYSMPQDQCLNPCVNSTTTCSNYCSDPRDDRDVARQPLCVLTRYQPDNDLCHAERDALEASTTCGHRYYRLIGSTTRLSGGQPGWQEVSEIELYDENGANVAPQATLGDLLSGADSSRLPNVVNNAFWPSEQNFLVWSGGVGVFGGQVLFTMTFSSAMDIRSGRLYTTNDESMGNNCKIQASNDGTTWSDLLTPANGGLQINYLATEYGGLSDLKYPTTLTPVPRQCTEAGRRVECDACKQSCDQTTSTGSARSQCYTNCSVCDNSNFGHAAWLRCMDRLCRTQTNGNDQAVYHHYGGACVWPQWSYNSSKQSECESECNEPNAPRAVATDQCYLAKSSQAPSGTLTSFVKYEDHDCMGIGGYESDSLRDFWGTEEECAAKCHELRESGAGCVGYIRVYDQCWKNCYFNNRCYFRTGELTRPVPEQGRNCFVPVSEIVEVCQYVNAQLAGQAYVEPKYGNLDGYDYNNGPPPEAYCVVSGVYSSAACDTFWNGVNNETKKLFDGKVWGQVPGEDTSVCGDLGEVCTLPLDASVLKENWKVWDWCSVGWPTQAECEYAGKCTTCNTTAVANETTCNVCCRCMPGLAGYYGELVHAGKERLCVNAEDQETALLQTKYPSTTTTDIRRLYAMNPYYDARLFQGNGGCMHYIDTVKLMTLVQRTACDGLWGTVNCTKPAANQSACAVLREVSGNPVNDFSFYQTTRRWRAGYASDEASCTGPKCVQYPAVTTQSQCEAEHTCKGGDCTGCVTQAIQVNTLYIGAPYAPASGTYTITSRLLNGYPVYEGNTSDKILSWQQVPKDQVEASVYPRDGWYIEEGGLIRYGLGLYVEVEDLCDASNQGGWQSYNGASGNAFITGCWQAYNDIDAANTKFLCQFVGSNNRVPTPAQCAALGGTFYNDTENTFGTCVTDRRPDSDPSNTKYRQCSGTVNSSSVIYQRKVLECRLVPIESCDWSKQTLPALSCAMQRVPCRTQGQCEYWGGFCDMHTDDNKVMADGGLCILKHEFPAASSGLQDHHAVCNSKAVNGLTTESKTFGCLVNKRVGSLNRSECLALTGGKWEQYAYSKAVCEGNLNEVNATTGAISATTGINGIKQYFWDTTTGKGTHMCCTDFSGDDNYFECRRWSMDVLTEANCSACGYDARWVRVFNWLQRGVWGPADWKAQYEWQPRAMAGVNMWTDSLNQWKLRERVDNTILNLKAYPVTNYATCRLNPGLSAFWSLANASFDKVLEFETAIFPGETTTTESSGFIVNTFSSTIAGTTPNTIGLKSESAENAVAKTTLTTTILPQRLLRLSNMQQRRLTSQSGQYEASCYALIKQDDKVVGQLTGACAELQVSRPLDGPVQMCFTPDDSIPVAATFTQDGFASRTGSGTFTALTTAAVSLSAGSTTICGNFSSAGTYCPIKYHADYQPGVAVPSSVPAGDDSCPSLSALDSQIQILAPIVSNLSSNFVALGQVAPSPSINPLDQAGSAVDTNGVVANRVAFVANATESVAATQAPTTTIAAATTAGSATTASQGSASTTRNDYESSLVNFAYTETAPIVVLAILPFHLV